MATSTAVMSDYFEENALKHLLGYQDITKPTSVEFALYSTDPTDANTGTELTAASNPGYAQVTIGSGDASVVQDGTGHSWVPNNDINWTATGNWTGPIAYIGILTHQNLIAHGAIDDGSGGAITVSSGQTLTISCNGTSSSNLKIKLK